mgnify:CR=1 FL=1
MVAVLEHTGVGLVYGHVREPATGVETIATAAVPLLPRVLGSRAGVHPPDARGCGLVGRRGA